MDNSGSTHITVIATPGTQPSPALLDHRGKVITHHLIVTVDTIRTAKPNPDPDSVTTCVGTFVAFWAVHMVHPDAETCVAYDYSHLDFSPWLHQQPMGDRIRIRQLLTDTAGAAYRTQSTATAFLALDGRRAAPTSYPTAPINAGLSGVSVRQ